MPRPTPIVIPGQTAMGGSWKKSDIQIPLGDILKLIGQYKTYQNEQAAGAAQVDLAKSLGLGGKVVQSDAELPGTSGEGIVSMPPKDIDIYPIIDLIT